MANDVKKITGYVVKEAARGYYNTRLFSGLVDKGYDSEFEETGAKKGDTIFVRLPAQYRIRTGANQEIQDVGERKIPVTLPEQKGVDFQFSTREATIDIDNDKRLYSERFIVPAGSALASDKDAEGQQIAAMQAGYTIVTAATPTTANFLAAKAMLNKMLAPKVQSSRFAVVGSDIESALVGEVKGLYNNAAAITKAIKEGVITDINGLTWATSDLAYVHVNGAGGLAVAINGAITADYTNETQWIALDGAGAASIVAGDTLQFAASYLVNPETKKRYANLAQRKVLAVGDGTNGGAIGTFKVYSLRPVVAAPATAEQRKQAAMANITALPADGSVVTVLGVSGTSYLCSLVMHKEAVKLTSVDLVKPSKVEMVDSVNVDGMVIRFIQDYSVSSDQMPNRLDNLSVYTVIHPEWLIEVQTPLA